MPLNFVGFTKLIIGSSPWAVMGLFYASIIYFTIPDKLKEVIGLLAVEYTSAKIFGIALILTSGFLLSFFTKFIIRKTPLLIKNVATYKKMRAIESEIIHDGLATMVLLKIREIELDLQEDSDTLGQPIEINLTSISNGIDNSGGRIRPCLIKLKDTGLMKINAFGEIIGISDKGVAFIIKNKLIK